MYDRVAIQVEAQPVWKWQPTVRSIAGELVAMAAGLSGFSARALAQLPFPFWPFHPEQTAFHYLMHVQYTLTQIPLVVIVLQQARRSAKRKGDQIRAASKARNKVRGDSE